MYLCCSMAGAHACAIFSTRFGFYLILIYSTLVFNNSCTSISNALPCFVLLSCIILSAF